MSANPIEWHEDCLRNAWLSVNDLLDAMKQAKSRYERSLKETQHYASQIARAKRLGKKAFDSERFKAEGKGE